MNVFKKLLQECLNVNFSEEATQCRLQRIMLSDKGILEDFLRKVFT